MLSCDSRPPASTQQASLRPSVAILRLGRKFSKIPHCAAAGIYDIIYAFTVKALMKTKKTSDRISEIVAEMHSITEFAEGSISSSSNSYPVKDGTRRKAKPHWKFQSLGPRGKGQEARGKRQALQEAREGILPPRDRGEPCRPKKKAGEG